MDVGKPKKLRLELKRVDPIQLWCAAKIISGNAASFHLILRTDPTTGGSPRTHGGKPWSLGFSCSGMIASYL